MLRLSPVSRFVGSVAAVCCLAAHTFADDLTVADRTASWVTQNQRSIVRQFNRAGVYGSIGTLGEGAGSGPGLAYFQPNVAGTPLDVYAGRAWSLDGDSLYDFRVGRIPHAPGHAPSRHRTLALLTPSLVEGADAPRFFAYAEMRRRSLVNGRLYGSESGARPFAYEDHSYELVLGHTLAPRLVASIRTGLLETRARLEPERSSASLPADVRRPAGDRSFLATTVSLAYDHRDRPRDPRNGTYVETSLARYHGTGPSSPSFDRFALDARQYLRLDSDRHVFALRGLIDVAGGSGGDGVPFFLQPALGGSRSLRGFPRYRFRGPRVATLSAEYRWEVLRPFALAAFYDAGRVWGGPAERGTGGIATSYGLGLVIKSKEGVLVRFDAAKGSEGMRLNVSFGHSF